MAGSEHAVAPSVSYITGNKELSAKKDCTPRSWLVRGDHLQLTFRNLASYI